MISTINEEKGTGGDCLLVTQNGAIIVKPTISRSKGFGIVLGHIEGSTSRFQIGEEVNRAEVDASRPFYGTVLLENSYG